MILERKKLLALVDRWEKKALSAEARFQESGERRHLREKENAEDMADALRMAANAEEDYSRLVVTRGRLASYEATGMTPEQIVALKAERDEAVRSLKEVTDWFNTIVRKMRDYSDGDAWSDGSEILCKTESGAEAISDLLFQLYADQGERPVIQTGYYDPEEDRRNGEEDYCTGWWYVAID